MRVTRPTTTRPAFTLTEMMVATALCLFIMLVISQAFGSATKTFSTMRTAGQLQGRLRDGITVIRRDLANDHFQDSGSATSGPKLANQRLDLIGWMPPAIGYFEIEQAGQLTGTEYKGSTIGEPAFALAPAPDAEGNLFSTRAAPADLFAAPATAPNFPNRSHMIRFTVRVPAGGPADLFCSEFEGHPGLLSDLRINAFPDASRNVIYSEWAEVIYFLRAPEGAGEASATAGVGGLPRFTLYRKVRLLGRGAAGTGAGTDIPYEDPALYPVPAPGFPGPKTPSAIIASTTVGPGPSYVPNPATMYPEVATVPIAGGFRVLGPDDVATNRDVRIAPTPTSKLGNPIGADILMTDVLSFEVKAAWIANPAFNLSGTSPNDYSGYSPNPSNFVVGTLPTTNPWLFTDAPFHDLPRSSLKATTVPGHQSVGRFDTWFNPSVPIDWNLSASFLAPANAQYLPPLRINVRAIQIKIRIWDPRAEQARQVTIIQEV